MSKNSYIEQPVINGLRKTVSDGEEFIRKTMVAYLNAAEDQVGEITVLIREEKFDEIAWLLHSIKAKSDVVGATRLSRACDQIREEIILSGRVDYKDVGVICDIFINTKKEINRNFLK